MDENKIENNLFIDLNKAYRYSYIIGEEEVGVENFQKIIEFITSKIKK